MFRETLDGQDKEMAEDRRDAITKKELVDNVDTTDQDYCLDDRQHRSLLEIFINFIIFRKFCM